MPIGGVGGQHPIGGKEPPKEPARNKVKSALNAAVDGAKKLGRAVHAKHKQRVEKKEAAKTDKIVLQSLKLTEALKAGSGFKVFSGSVTIDNFKTEMPRLKKMVEQAPENDQHRLNFNAETLIGINALKEMKDVKQGDTAFLDNLSDLLDGTDNMNYDLKEEIKAIKTEIEGGNGVSESRIDDAISKYTKELPVQWQT